jgi:hypothetical protein
MTRTLLIAALAAAVLAPQAPAGRIAVGLAPGADREAVGARVEAATGGTLARDLGPLDALIVSVEDADSAAAAAADLAGVEYAEPAGARRRLAFVPNDPLLEQQWYVPYVRAFDFWPEKPAPPPEPVLVAVVDSGLDATHPEFGGRVAAGQSFVRTAWTEDFVGHGTLVAGELAATLDNAVGIAGLGFPVSLLIAKVVADDGSISLEAEARAIRWAVDRGVRVINLSLGGPRDPNNPQRDTFSQLEQEAIEYATRNGVLVVASVGNCSPPGCPYRYAYWPSALPHVLGVSALARDSATPVFSNRDEIYNDLAAPGKGIVSTFPLALTDPACPTPGYTPCAKEDTYRRGEGTSFAAPLVSAAAALVLSRRPGLEPSQLMALLEGSASDVGPVGRDRLSGWGGLDVTAALTAADGPLPPPDRFEPNDDAGARAHSSWGRRRTVQATLDFYDDPVDVYRVQVARGQEVSFSLRGPQGADLNLVLWKPATKSVLDISPEGLARRIQTSARPGARESIRYVAPVRGWYFIEVRASSTQAGAYRLVIAKS